MRFQLASDIADQANEHGHGFLVGRVRIGKPHDQSCLGKAALGKAEARRFIQQLCLSFSVRDLAGVPPAFVSLVSQIDGA
jgi:hypothetical protein